LADKVSAEVDDRKILQRIGRELAVWDHENRQVLSAIGQDAELIFAAHAPKGESGRLARGIKARNRGTSIFIEARAIDPKTGFDYVRVSRFGHRVRRIFPGGHARSIFSEARFTKTGSVRSRAVGGARALATPWGPRAWVRGFHPARDWAEPAYKEVQKVAGEHMDDFGKKITRRLGTG
jgi:hypothetical protein